MPAEVMWEIFDNLEDETKQSLKALRLTSRIISLRATAGLFRHISYTHGSLQSWEKIYAISTNKVFADSVQTLKLRTSSCYYPPYSMWDSTLDNRIDLAQFPHLKTFQCEDMWTMIKPKPTISLPKRGCILEFRPDMKDFAYEWEKCKGYVRALQRYGFEYTSESINLLKSIHPVDAWENRWRSLDLSKLRTVDIFLQISPTSTGPPRSTNPTIGILDLPSLTSFKLRQTVPPAIEGNYRGVDVIQGLVRNNFNWPNLRDVDFRDAYTSSKDMRHFLRHYLNKLDSVRVHGGMQLQYRSGPVWTSDALRERQLRQLSSWIHERVAPRKLDFVFRK